MARLCDSLDVKGLHLANRFVMAPMVTGLAVGHAPTEAQIQWYRVRARGGVGLIVVESAAIAPDGLLMPFQMGIWDDAQVPGLARWASAIRAEGVPAVLQIVHGGARAWRAEIEAERLLRHRLFDGNAAKVLCNVVDPRAAMLFCIVMMPRCDDIARNIARRSNRADGCDADGADDARVAPLLMRRKISAATAITLR